MTYPDERQVLADRDHWVLTVRPMLVAAGNLKMTPEMADEERAVRARLFPPAKTEPVKEPEPEDDGGGEVPF